MKRGFDWGGNLAVGLVLSKPARMLGSALNRLPLPYGRMPVYVDNYRMFAHTADRYLALWLRKMRLLGAFESDLLAKLCERGMLAVDIGANIGFHSLHIARAVGDAGHVWSFEPEPRTFEALRRNLRENRIANVSAVNSAVSAAPGRTPLYLSRAHAGDHRSYEVPHDRRPTVMVDAVSLDAFFPLGQRIDFIKMDIQGAEGTALAGMRGILASNAKIVILMEFWPQGLRQARQPPEGVLAGLQAAGFTLECVDERSGLASRVQGAQDFVRSLRGRRYVNLLARRG